MVELQEPGKGAWEGSKGRAVINIGIRLDDPDEFLDRVVEVQFDLVRR
jgi:hypothetical protein